MFVLRPSEHSQTAIFHPGTSNVGIALHYRLATRYAIARDGCLSAYLSSTGLFRRILFWCRCRLCYVLEGGFRIRLRYAREQCMRARTLRNSPWDDRPGGR